MQAKENEQTLQSLTMFIEPQPAKYKIFFANFIEIKYL